MTPTLAHIKLACMKRQKLSAILTVVVAAFLFAGAPAVAQNTQGQNNNNQDQNSNDQGGLRSIPEFDPAAVGAIAAIVAAGGILLVRRRRASEKVSR